MKQTTIKEDFLPTLENGDGAFTRHVFVGKKPCRITFVAGEGAEPVDQDAIELVYQCTQTGQQRRFGVQ